MSAREPSPGVAQRVAVVTGTRAEFGLLTPVMRAIEDHAALELCTFLTGTHLLGPAFTRTEVERRFRVDAEIPMQRAGETGRLADATALGRGIEGIAREIGRVRPGIVLVLGDRIEALAGASAASVAGVCVGHIHGGDRAEGIADEAMRHAITKLSHVHLAATEESALRIERMGEDAARIHVVGSPAIDGLAGIEPLEDEAYAALGSPLAVFLMHPEGGDDRDEWGRAGGLLLALWDAFGERVLCLHPNFDAGREGVLGAIEDAVDRDGLAVREHLERGVFVGLLRRLARDGGIMAGNSSAGLIEAAALGLPVVDYGSRQAGRERACNVLHTDRAEELSGAIEGAASMDRGAIVHPYGEGRAGERIAGILASVDPLRGELLRKRCAY